MNRHLFLLALLLMFMSCQKDYDNINSPSKLLPSKTESVIIINELNDFVNSIKHHDILSSVYNKESQVPLNVLNNLNTSQQVFIGFLNQNNSDYLILTENDSTLFIIDSVRNHISENLPKLDINKVQIDSTVFYHKTYGNTFAASNKLNLLKDLNIENANNELIRLTETADRKSIASVIFKSNSPVSSKFLFSDDDHHLSENYSVIDLNYSDKNLQFNGITTSKDSIKYKIDCFKNTIPQKTNSPKIASSQSSTLLSITYDDFSFFNKNLSLLNQIDIDSSQTFLNFTDEIALIDNSIVLHSLDSDLVLESIEEKSNIESFRAIDIYEFGLPDFFKSRLQPFITYENAKYFLTYDEFTIFSDSIDSLKSILSDILNNNTLANTEAFKSISDHLSDEASLFIFKNSKSLSKLLDKNVKGYNANAVQFIYEDDYAHVNGIIQKFKKRSALNSVTESFTTTIEADIISAPQTVKNHVTGAHDIAVQDVNNVLYLISSSGSILWKKQLRGKILGKIEQIDMYKNGRLQLAFATPKRLYVLDRNGNNVSPFPLQFNDNITQPLAIFDYDKKKNYRLLVTQDKNLLMYDAKGRSINGFSYQENGSKINSQPKHFRIGSKDYITFAAGNQLKILNRQGKVRINVKDKIRFSENGIFLYKNKFTTTNTLGQLVQVDTKGKLNTTNLNLSNQHQLETTSKTLVLMTENQLKIKTRTIDLDYGDYTSPRIFYINDKIYVTITDLQSKKVYLYDSQAKPIANFPVYGTSAAELQQLDSEKGLELMTQSDDKTIIVYKIH